MLRPLVLLLLVACAGAAYIACGGDDGRVEVRIGDRLAINVELALTPAERAQGLGGRDSLAQDAGMLFVFGQEQLHAFWMRGMRFPLDFIWISADGRVVDLTENVPPPEPDTADSELALYRPDEPVLYTLEVNAGVVTEAGVEVGDEVTFEPEVPADGVQ